MSVMLREVTADEIEAFWRDGIVCLRNILDPQLLHDMSEPVAALIGTSGVADLSAMGDAIAASGKMCSAVMFPRLVEADFSLALIIGLSIRSSGISHATRCFLRSLDKS